MGVRDPKTLYVGQWLKSGSKPWSHFTVIEIYKEPITKGASIFYGKLEHYITNQIYEIEHDDLKFLYDDDMLRATIKLTL